MPKSVKVHDDTHRALKQMKSSRRSASIDEVIKKLIKASTGESVERLNEGTKIPELTSYIGE